MHMPTTGPTDVNFVPVFSVPASCRARHSYVGQLLNDVRQEVQLGHAELHFKYKYCTSQTRGRILYEYVLRNNVQFKALVAHGEEL